jgi:DnaJ-class molecular chaperone
MSRIVLVHCPDCGGTGYGHNRPVCGHCLGQMHIAVDRTLDGGCPDGYREWRDKELPPLELNPLRLTYDARAQR